MNKFYDLFETVNTDTNDSVSTCIDSFLLAINQTKCVIHNIIF